MGIIAIVLIVFRNDVPVLFNLGEEASLLASSFLLVACAYLLFDGFQTVASGALRGIGDVKIIAVAAFICYWIIGCPTALLLAFPLGMNGVGVWIGLASGLGSMALILGWRVFRDLAKNPRGSDIPALP
jgi:MATE family multidrug resistance protein